MDILKKPNTWKTPRVDLWLNGGTGPRTCPDRDTRHNPLVEAGGSMAGATPERVDESIVEVRGQRIILDADLARVYDVPTKALNQAVKRNRGRFPIDFCFRLTPAEAANLRSQFVTSNGRWGGRRTHPLAFTEHGALMAASVLNSARAVQMSVFVVRAFLRLRGLVLGQAALASRLNELERRVAGHDHDLKTVIQSIRQFVHPPEKPKRRIGFGGGTA